MTKLSVVIPLSIEAWRPMPIFESLIWQTADPADFETIVVLDRGALVPEPLRMIESRVRIVRFDQYPTWWGRHTAGAKRNAGAAVTEGQRIVFLDSDCAMDPACLSRHLAYADSSLAVCGWMGELPFRRIEACAGKSFDEIQTGAERDDRERYLAAKEPTSASFLQFYSANASVPRSAFERIGGFDDSGHRCHDIDLAARLQGEGVGFVFDPTVRVVHFEHPRSIEHRVQQVVGLQRTASKMPELGAILARSSKQLRRSYAEVLKNCQARFKVLCEALPVEGKLKRAAFLRTGSNDRVIATLRDMRIPFLLKVSEEERVYYLRLHRSCWDFRLIVRKKRQVEGAPFLSIIVPAWNEEHVLARCLESALVDASDDVEIVVVDDASRDGTLEVASGYGAIGRLKIVACRQNRGLSSALNAGLSASSGEFVMHLDADDELLEGALQRIRRDLLELEDADALTYASLDEPGILDVERGFKARSAREVFFELRQMYPRIYRRTAIESIGGWATNDAFKGRLAEDRWILYRMAKSGHCVYEGSWPAARVYARRQSLSRRNRAKAAAAKLGIFAFEAGALCANLVYKYRSGSLLGRIERNEPTSKRSWSVVIPCHNCGRRLTLALASWATVTRARASEVEIFVIDDGSSPPVEIPSEMNGFVRLIRFSERKGPAEARNAGVSAASGELLLFSDGDHLVPPNVLEEHERLHETQGSDLIVFGGMVRPKAETVNRDEGSLVRLVRGALSRNRSLADIDIWRLAYRISQVPESESTWLRLFLEAGVSLEGVWCRWLRAGCGGMSMFHESFRQAGGFDRELLRFEDWEFALRWLREGGYLHFASGATPVHQMHPRASYVYVDKQVSQRRFSVLHSDVIRRIEKERTWRRIPAAADLIQK